MTKVEYEKRIKELTAENKRLNRVLEAKQAEIAGALDELADARADLTKALEDAEYKRRQVRDLRSEIRGMNNAMDLMVHGRAR